MSHPTTSPDGRDLLSLAGDAGEDRGTSALGDLGTVGEIRKGLTDIRAWATSRPHADVCFVAGGLRELAGWCDRAEHLLRKLPDEAIAVEVPRKALAAFDEIASWAVRVAVDTGVPDAAVPATVPHLARFLAAVRPPAGEVNLGEHACETCGGTRDTLTWLLDAGMVQVHVSSGCYGADDLMTADLDEAADFVNGLRTRFPKVAQDLAAEATRMRVAVTDARS